MTRHSQVPNTSPGARSGNGLSPLNRNASGPFDPRAEGNTVDVVNDYLTGLDGPAASSERLRVLHLESQQERPRLTVRGMARYLDDGSDEYDTPDEGEEDAEQDPADGSGDAGESAGQDAEQGEEGQTSVDGSTVTES